MHVQILFWSTECLPLLCAVTRDLHFGWVEFLADPLPTLLTAPCQKLKGHTLVCCASWLKSAQSPTKIDESQRDASAGFWLQLNQISRLRFLSTARRSCLVSHPPTHTDITMLQTSKKPFVQTLTWIGPSWRDEMVPPPGRGQRKWEAAGGLLIWLCVCSDSAVYEQARRSPLRFGGDTPSCYLGGMSVTSHSR